MKLNILDSIPDGFLDTVPEEMYKILDGPSLIQIEGEPGPPLFLATLLHGNESTGIQAIQKVIKFYNENGMRLPKPLNILVGNVEAARTKERHLEHQPDYNRIWNGGDLKENKFAQEVISLVKNSGPFASIDIHNTSGQNPHYSCVNKLDAPFINLANLFSETLVYFTRPKEVLSNAMAEFCPSITIEAGQPGDPSGIQHVYEFLKKCLRLEKIPLDWKGQYDPQVYHTIARVRVPPESKIGFGDDSQDKDFCFIEKLDQKNFHELPANSLIGWRSNPDMKLSVINESDEEIESDIFDYVEKEIRLKRSVVPSMFTTNENIVHQDCLGYFMERFAIDSNNRSI
ncbi:MAG: peptidase M14 [Candidatus Nitronauta litoralis]|uniref:Peptidase M14 n=1 Tax=Candidatus Nitronauta litoralis TaxID=2705533 RepID=A0A7T0BXM3_9BACT|nr:MAG: peptidase M14 [Candidatus Nitronauta litoralis]